MIKAVKSVLTFTVCIKAITSLKVLQKLQEEGSKGEGGASGSVPRVTSGSTPQCSSLQMPHSSWKHLLRVAQFIKKKTKTKTTQVPQLGVTTQFEYFSVPWYLSTEGWQKPPEMHAFLSQHHRLLVWTTLSEAVMFSSSLSAYGVKCFSLAGRLWG